MKYVRFGKSKIAFFFLFAVLNLSAVSSEVLSQKIKNKENKSNLPAKTADDFDADELQIFILVNAERTKQGLNALVSDDAVAKIARDYSEKMAQENFFSHYDASGNSVLERAKAARLKHWSRIGENLFSIENLAKFDVFAVKNWMKSLTHRQNILDREWTTTGVGIAKSETGEIFITQVFIKR